MPKVGPLVTGVVGVAVIVGVRVPPVSQQGAVLPVTTRDRDVVWTVKETMSRTITDILTLRVKRKATLIYVIQKPETF